MSRTATPKRESRGAAYITATPQGKMDREAHLHQRRKQAMVSLLAEFEREIQPLIAGGHDKAIADFKRSCREKLNALTFEALELMALQPGEEVNEHAVDLAARLGFGNSDGGP